MEPASSINLFTSPEMANDPVNSAKLTAASIASLAAARIESGDWSADLASQLQEITRQLAEAESQNRLTEAELAARAKALEREAEMLARLRLDFEKSRDEWEASQEQLVKNQRQWTQQVQKQDNLLQNRLDQLEAYSLQLKAMPAASADAPTDTMFAPILESRISHQREAQLEAMLRDAEDREGDLLNENRELEERIENLSQDLQVALGKGSERLMREDYTSMTDELQSAQKDADRLRHQLGEQDAEMETIRAEIESLRSTRAILTEAGIDTSDESTIQASMQALLGEGQNQATLDQEALRQELLKQAEAEKENLRQELQSQAEAEREALKQEIWDQANAEKESLKQQILEQATAEQEAIKQQILEQATAEQETLKQQLEQAAAEQEAFKRELLDKASQGEEALKQQILDQAEAEKEAIKQQILEQVRAEKESLLQEHQQKEASYQDALEQAEQRLKELEGEYAASMAKLEEAGSQQEVSAEQQGEMTQLEEEIDMLKRRYEMAMDDLKELKGENAKLKQELQDAAAQIAIGDVAQESSDRGPGDFLDWEEEKRRLMAMLESDYQEDEGATPEQQAAAQAERMKIEDVIEQTDRVIQIKTQEIIELKALLEDQSSQVGNLAVGVGAFEAAFNQDELITGERENLKRLQDELHEKLKKAEVEISIERAKVARERSEMDEMLSALGLTKEKMQEAYQDTKSKPSNESESSRTIDPKSNKQTRWFNQMGLKDEEE